MGTGSFQLVSARVGTINLKLGSVVENTPIDQPLVVTFSEPIVQTAISQNFDLKKNGSTDIALTFSFLDNGKTVSALPNQPLEEGTTYDLHLTDEIKSEESGENFAGIDFQFVTAKNPLVLEQVTVDGQDLKQTGRITDVSRMFAIEATFSHPVDLTELGDNLFLSRAGFPVEYELSYGNNEQEIIIASQNEEPYLSKITLRILGSLQSKNGNPFTEFNRDFYTAIDETPKFPIISDEELLTLVQQQTFKYFWDFGHPVSGLSRERSASTNTVTSGGSGFGLMAIVVGMERGFITRAEGIERLEKIIDFLQNKSDRFHGVWSHWLNGETGKVVPFSPNDNGGDLVETSYLVMGLLTVRQYLNLGDPQEQTLINDINDLWHTVEWDWHTQGGQNVLYWHWSPNFAWEKNHKIGGWNEALITYIMAASSPTYPISKEVYDNGWARNGAMVNGGDFYGIELPLGPNVGGPLFFEQYTFLGINPTMLSDQYANYWQQAVNHTLINRQHCILNPNNFVAYSERCWGLTASDGNSGYSAHSPTNDRGVITPTAALSSFPFTPDESMEALHFFYYTMGDRLWGEYGFYDAFNPTAGWTASSFLAIDQGPIIGMIENYRTRLLWDLFMSAPEVQEGLTKLGFDF